MAAESDRTRELCAFLATFDYGNLPEKVIKKTKILVLDHLGVALHSLEFPWTKIIRDYAMASAGVEESTIYGMARKVPKRVAAFANGTAAHSVELDDTHTESFSHPGAVIVAAAISVAEAVNASGTDFLTAIVAGYEAQGRIGSAAKGAAGRGFHPTATAGVFGAATAAARLLKLSREQFESAFGLAESTASGVMQFADDPERNMVKRLFGGMPAQNGVMAAELAKAGFLGPRKALDGRYGFLHMFGGSTDTHRLTRDLGTTWEVEHVGFKLYACCRHFHATMDAIRECRKKLAFDVEDIQKIQVSITEIALDGRMHYRPKSMMAAQYSLPYAIAATLLLEPEDPRSYGEEAFTRTDMTALMDRVSAQADPELEQYLPERFPGGVTVILKDGRRISSIRKDATGTPDYPLGNNDIVSKFRILTKAVADAEWQDQMLEAVVSLDAVDETDGFKALLRHLRTLSKAS